MKKILVYCPVVLSLVLLGAHCLRHGNSVGVVAAALLIALLVVRRAWVARLLQVGLVLGALEWMLTLYELVQLRAASGQPVMRLAIILGLVTAVTFCSALLFQLPIMKKIYRLKPAE